MERSVISAYEPRCDSMLNWGFVCCPIRVSMNAEKQKSIKVFTQYVFYSMRVHNGAVRGVCLSAHQQSTSTSDADVKESEFWQTAAKNSPVKLTTFIHALFTFIFNFSTCITLFWRLLLRLTQRGLSLKYTYKIQFCVILEIYLRR